MTHQDYVSRTKNKKNPYKKQQVPAPKVVTAKLKLLIVVALTFGIGFGYLLWSIKDITPEETTTVNSKPATKKATTLPEPPKEKWAYPQQLQEKEVDAGEYTVEDRGPWKMQCGSFRTQQQAEKMKATIAFAGLSSHISASSGSNGTWHKVYLGPYDKKRDAERDKHKLRGNRISTCQIWLWR
ncbi:SPOR domain-containing protein [Thalassotalea hakodatensis]|uniref:SPOR domain-containing protein n=1 Tax=Thalassotalea hakodatensis TaxID=3030492 RepID=UPI00257297A5|nr:SPOR domain-containing protein [Thalassotalea hakodatensis]